LRFIDNNDDKFAMQTLWFMMMHTYYNDCQGEISIIFKSHDLFNRTAEKKKSLCLKWMKNLEGVAISEKMVIKKQYRIDDL
jgi:hypothetical protein